MLRLGFRATLTLMSCNFINKVTVALLRIGPLVAEPHFLQVISTQQNTLKFWMRTTKCLILTTKQI